jgi:hypothetical protein
MTQKTDWELLDTTARHTRPASLPDMLKTLLGRHWRWKLAGIALVAGLALTLVIVFAVTLAGIAVLVLGATALFSLAVARLRRWLGREQRALVR